MGDTIKVTINLDIEDRLEKLFELQKQWENEGGAVGINQADEFGMNEHLPFLPGDQLNVLDGHVQVENGHHIYNVTFERIS
jgi:hypothetical protein